MIKITDIYTAVNALLRSKYPGIKIYGNEVIDGYSKPSFFVAVLMTRNVKAGVNTRECAYTVKITYFQKIINQMEALEKADEIGALFDGHLPINDRKVLITDFDYEFVGDRADVLQVGFDIEFLDGIERTEPEKVAAELLLNEKTEG